MYLAPGSVGQVGNPHAPRQGVGVSYEPEATALFARFTTPPTDARKLIINDFWKAPGIKSIMAKMDALYMLAAADAQAARRNWKADQFNLTAVSGPTFTADQGYAGDGAGSYLDTGFNPVTAAGLFVQDNAHLGLWSRTNVANSGYIDIGARQGSTARQSSILMRNAADQLAIRLNQNSADTVVGVTDSSGHFLTRRASAAAAEQFRNATLIGTGAQASAAPMSLSWALLAVNNNGTIAGFSTRQLAAAHMGGSLTDTEISDLYTAINAYLQAVGAA